MVRALSAVAVAVLITLLAVAGRGSGSDAASAEQERVRTHLERVERRLRAADVSHLTEAQRAARAAQLDRLRDYRRAGIFPHNHGRSSGPIPVFVDEHGTHCAVGHLLAQSGETALVARIAATRNTAAVPDLADEPGLLEWLDANGLSAAEAAAIQPWYGPVYDVEVRDGRYAGATAVLTAASAAAATWNLLTPRTGDARILPGVVGVMTGAASLGWGVAGVDRERVEGGFDGAIRYRPANLDIALNLVAGIVSAALGTRTLLSGGDESPRADRNAADRGGARLELTPTGTGLHARLRF